MEAGVAGGGLGTGHTGGKGQALGPTGAWRIWVCAGGTFRRAGHVGCSVWETGPSRGQLLRTWALTFLWREELAKRHSSFLTLQPVTSLLANRDLSPRQSIKFKLASLSQILPVREATGSCFSQTDLKRITGK
jgi:hypothetical protein